MQRAKYQRVLYMKRRDQSEEVGEGHFKGQKWFWAKCGGFTTRPENAKVFQTFGESEVVRRHLVKERIFVMCDPVPVQAL